MPSKKLTNIPANSLNPRSTNRNDPIFDRHQDSPLLRTYQYVQDQEAVDTRGVVRTAVVDKVIWGPKDGAPRGIYGCVVSLDDDLINTVEKMPNNTASRSHALQKFKFRVQGSCNSAPRTGQVIEVVIIPDSTNIIGKFHYVSGDYISPPAVSEKVENDKSAQQAHSSGTGTATTPSNPGTEAATPAQAESAATTSSNPGTGS